MRTLKRSKLFVDPKLQGVLLKRVVVYWVACLLFITLPTAIGYTLANEEMPVAQIVANIWNQSYSILVAMLVLLPIAVLDVLSLSNKFVGPIYRIRKLLAGMAEGEKSEPINFREGDFWQELTESCNVLVDKLEKVTGDNTTALPSSGEAQSPDEESSAESVVVSETR